ncbi:MAG TPA: sugar ABC transporter substrate-binding protein [Nocardioidaceae bacterium]|nr:sugar ABC transporter substrate-binding protein [Nocardioidaceae bacterium]
MRLRHLGIGLAALAMIASACGDDGGGEQQSLSSEAEESITPGQYEGETLDVWIMEGTNPDATPFFDKVRTAFKEQTGADLNVQFVEWANAYDKFTTGIAGGELPDVAEVGTTWTPGFADAGGLVDLTDRIEEAGLTDDVVPALLETGELDGAVYGMPWYSGVRSIVYRTDIFAKAGIKPPQSWDDLAAACGKLKSAEPDMVPFPIAGGSEYGVDPFIWGAGGEIATGSGGQWKATLDSDEAREGISYYTGLATDGGCSTPQASTWDETDLSEAFSAGDAAMIIAGSWTPKALIEANPDLAGKIGVFPIPGPDGGLSPSFLGGSHLGIFNTTAKNKLELAWYFVQMMTTGEFAKTWAKQTGFFPSQSAQLEEMEAADDPLVSPFVTQVLEAGATVPVTPAYSKIQGNATITAMLNSILTGKASVEEATETANQEMNDVFASG